MAEQKSKLPARVHPDDRARIETLNALNRQFHGAPKEKAPLSYYTPELIQCTLPHSDPKVNPWMRQNGTHTLMIASGFNERGEPFGIPYGSFPRLVMAYIITQVVQKGEARIDFQSFFITFLKEVGYTSKPNIKSAKSLHDGLERLLYATITHDVCEKEEGRARKSFIVAPKSVLWWNHKSPDQGSLWSSFIEISEEFRQSILSAPVPLHTDMLAALKKSPLAIDVYMWVSYRLYNMLKNQQDDLSLSYGNLQMQFGTGIAEEFYRQFRYELKNAFKKVAEKWEEISEAEGKKLSLKYDLHETGLTLYRSELLVAKAKPSAIEEEWERLLSRRRFNDVTRKEARQLAGSMWSVEYLETQYFNWIEKKSITPKAPKAHFFNFIKTHRKRNG